jgi:hypothetical protein
MLADSLHAERAAIRFCRDLLNRAREVDPVTAKIAARRSTRSTTRTTWNAC